MRQQRVGGRLSLTMGYKHKWRCCYLSREKPKELRVALDLILLRLGPATYSYQSQRVVVMGGVVCVSGDGRPY